MNSKIGGEQIITFNSGMIHDADISARKSNSYDFAENVRISVDKNSTFGSVTPIESHSVVYDGSVIKGTLIHSDSIRDIAVIFTNNSGRFNIYRVINELPTLIFDIEYTSSNMISSVIRYEDDDNIKLYWTDGVGQINVLNIASSNDSNNISIDNILSIKAIPAFEYDKPIIDGIGSGSLTAGRYQYAYRLRSKSGTLSPLSVLSEIVNSVKQDGSGGKKLSDSSESTGSSIRIKIKKPTSGLWSGMLVYSIHYTDFNSTQEISLILDTDITEITDEYIYAVDSGVSMLDEITVSEFQQIGLNSFSAKTIESKDDILFAGNISDLSYNVDNYDTRAYRFKGDADIQYSGDIDINIEQEANNVSISRTSENANIYTNVYVATNIRAQFSVDENGSQDGYLDITATLIDTPTGDISIPFKMTYKDSNNSTVVIIGEFPVAWTPGQTEYTVRFALEDLGISSFSYLEDIIGAQITFSARLMNFTMNGKEFLFTLKKNGVEVQRTTLVINQNGNSGDVYSEYADHDSYTVTYSPVGEIQRYSIRLERPISWQISGNLTLSYSSEPNRFIPFTMLDGVAVVSEVYTAPESMSATFGINISESIVSISIPSAATSKLLVKYNVNDLDYPSRPDTEMIFTINRGDTISNEISVFPGGDLEFSLVSATYTSNKTRLYMQSGLYNEYREDSISDVPQSHDCIHKEIYEVEKYSDLEYTKDIYGNEGGTGPNVSYIFANTIITGAKGGSRFNHSINPSSQDIGQKYIDDRVVRVGSGIKNINSLNIFKSDGITEDISLTEFGVSEIDGRFDYSNSIISGVLQGYKRDEIYRFAAVFHSTDGRKSKAMWIADIRFPAGYYSDSNWNSSVFDVPDKFQSSKYQYSEFPNIFTNVDGVNYVDEVILKPLGIEFSFKNLSSIQDLSKIEIVRAKRDINNRTVYSQSAISKTGTFSAANHYSAATKKDLKFYDVNNGGTIRPHPTLAMGYALAMAPIAYDPHTVRYQSSSSALITGYENSNSSGMCISFESYADGYPIQAEREAGHGMPYIKNKSALLDISPYFSSPDTFMLVSPEYSYYGDDYVEQLRTATSRLKLVVSSVLYPKITPVVKTLLQTDTSASAYIGSTDNWLMRFNYSGNVYPTAVYSSANLTEDLIGLETLSSGITSSDGTFFSSGLAGIHPLLVYTGSGPAFNSGGFDGKGYFDVFPYESIESPEHNMHRVYLSGNGIIARNSDYAWVHKIGLSSDAVADDKNSGINPISNGSSSDPLFRAARARYIDAGLGSETFKYYNYVRFGTGDYSTSKISVISQNGSDYLDVTYKELSSIGDFDTVSINDFEYSGDITEATSHHAISTFSSIGGKSFANFSKSLGKMLIHGDITDAYRREGTIERGQSSGPHGSGMLISVKKGAIPSILRIYNNDSVYSFNSIFKSNHNIMYNRVSSALSTIIVDIKQMKSSIYGGASRQDRQFTEYISTGCIITPESESCSKVAFGGDTYISMFDYTITRALDQQKDGESGSNSKDNWWNDVIAAQCGRIGAIIPMETSINTMVDSHGSYTNVNNVMIQKLPGVYSPGASHGTQYVYSQQSEEHDYNAAYSSERTAIGFNSSVFNEEVDNKYDCRVLASEKKTNDEINDSWSIFKQANYIDVDTRSGEITRLKTHADKLIFFQESAVGVLSVNDRSLISDDSGMELSLGTGGVLSRYDYITNESGVDKDTIKGVISTESGLYWFDKKTKSIFRFSNSVEQITKTKGVQSVFNSSELSNKVNFWKNKKYNEIIATVSGLSDNYTYKNIYD